MTQTNHSDLMNDMDRATQELSHLMTSFRTIHAEREEEHARSQELATELATKLAAELADEEKYADALHDSLSEMKLTLLRVNDELTREKQRSANLYRDMYGGQIAAGLDDPAYMYHVFTPGQEQEKRKTPFELKSEELAAEKKVSATLREELGKLRSDMETMHRLRDEVIGERDQLAAELLETITDRDKAVEEKNTVMTKMDEIVAQYNEDSEDLRRKVLMIYHSFLA